MKVRKFLLPIACLIIVSGFTQAKTNRRDKVSKVVSNQWVIPKTEIAPSLDGMVDPVWNAIDNQPLEYFNCSAEPVTKWSDFSGWCKLMWDNNNLYGLFYVMDDVVDTTSGVDWQMDGVDVYIDPGNTHTSGSILTGLQRQFSFRLPQKIDSVEAVYGHGLQYRWFLDAASISGGGPMGYYVEFQFPLDSLGIVPCAGQKFSLELQEDDNDGTPSGRIHISKWANATGLDNDWQQTLHWGNAVLGDTTTGADVDNTYSYVFMKTPAPPALTARTVTDGYPSDPAWSCANQLTMVNPGQGASWPSGPQDQDWRFYGLYDNNNIYGFFIVYDATVDSTSFIDWQMDGVDVYFDPGNIHSSGSTLTGLQRQFSFRLPQKVDSVENVIGKGCQYKWRVLPNTGNDSVFSSCRGYAVQFQFSLDSLGISPGQGTRFSFELQTDDNDGDGRSHVTKWWNTSLMDDDWQNTSHWGNAKLGPSFIIITPNAPSAPTLANPVNGSTGVINHPTLSWNASTGAETYGIQVSTDPTFVTTNYDTAEVPATGLTVNRLLYETKYYWRVNASNYGGTSGWSSIWNFTTCAPPPYAPALISVKDVPFDQGGKVQLIWHASLLDTNVNAMPYYCIWRAIPQSATRGVMLKNSVDKLGVPGKARKMRVTNTGAGSLAWEWLADQPAHKDSLYSYAASTLNDSMQGNEGIEYFMVSAQTADPNVFYDSNIQTGYSVDNIPPLPPQSVVASIVSGKVVLRWSANTEPDLKDYLVYRSDSTIPDSDKMPPYDTASGTVYTDMHPLAGQTAYYVLRAEDIHGNLSSVSNQVSAVATGVENQHSGIPTEYSLGQNYPNPFNPTTVISYQLPVVSNVTLRVYDVLGREVETLVNERQTAGNYSVTIDARDLPSGLYFYRLQAGSYTATKKLLLLK
ncbi:MAG TPA: sugar-binding protein [Candidatus Acidoferrales bacterium]|nr:sugar-binding protein [Candidatus Acidoferrales bacterium]